MRIVKGGVIVFTVYYLRLVFIFDRKIFIEFVLRMRRLMFREFELDFVVKELESLRFG